MAYSGEPGTAALAKRLVTIDGQLCLRVGGEPEPVPVDEDRVDAVMAELEWRSANARKASVGAGVVCLLLVYAGLFRGLEWWEPLLWCAAVWLVLTIGLSAYMGAPLRQLLREAVAAHRGELPVRAGTAARQSLMRALAERRGHMLLIALALLFVVARRWFRG